MVILISIIWLIIEHLYKSQSPAVLNLTMTISQLWRYLRQQHALDWTVILLYLFIVTFNVVYETGLFLFWKLLSFISHIFYGSLSLTFPFTFSFPLSRAIAKKLESPMPSVLKTSPWQKLYHYKALTHETSCTRNGVHKKLSSYEPFGFHVRFIWIPLLLDLDYLKHPPHKSICTSFYDRNGQAWAH